MDTNRRILVIDDNEANQADFRKILGALRDGDDRLAAAAAELFGEPPAQLQSVRTVYEVDTACQGEQGLAMVEQSVQTGRPYALAFVDVRMPPGWDGVETVRRLWQADPALLAVICTAYSDYSWQDMVRELGETDQWLILKKPFDNVVIRQLASSLRRKWELARQAEAKLNRLEQVIAERTAKVHEQTRALRQAHEETIVRLVRASMFRDDETGAHVRRTGLYSELLAATVGWTAELTERIRLAAPMHDVGKIGIPDAILRKPGPLTPDETAIMRTHTYLGAKMLAGSASPVLQMAQQIALCHHERIDGTGYPAGMAGDAIPEAARIVAIVDFYDALSHNRVYRPSFPEARVVQMLHEGRGTHFDPRLLDTFMSLLPEMRAIAELLPDDAETEGFDFAAGPAAGEFAVHRSAVPVTACMASDPSGSWTSEFA
jgi:putative two-component system response regulator